MGWDIVVYAGSVLGRLQFGLMAVSDFLMPLARVRIPIPMPIFAALLVAGCSNTSPVGLTRKVRQARLSR